MLFISIFLLVISFIIFYSLNDNSLFKINYISFLFWMYIVFGIFGAFIIYSGIVDETYFVQAFYNNNLAKQWGMFSIIYGLFGILIGIVIVNIMVSKSLSIKWTKYYNKNIEILKFKKEIFFLLIIACIPTVYYIYMIHPSPLYMIFLGYDSFSVAIRRNEVTEFFDGVGIIKGISIIFIQILAIYTFLYYFNKRKKILLFLISFSLASYVLLMTGEKANFIIFVFSIILSYVYSVSKINFKYISFIFMIIIFIIFFMYIFIMNSDLNNILFKINERIFIAQAIAPFLSFDYYINHNFIYFNSMESSIFKIFNEEKVQRSSELFMTHYYPGMREQGGWNINGIYIHEAFSNFGFLGLILAPIYVGVINGLIIQFFIKQKKTILNVTFFSYLSADIFSILTSFNQLLFNTKVIILFLFLFLFYGLNKINVKEKNAK